MFPTVSTLPPWPFIASASSHFLSRISPWVTRPPAYLALSFECMFVFQRVCVSSSQPPRPPKKWNSFTAAGEQLKSNCGAASSVIVEPSACLPFQPPTSLDLLLHLGGLLLGLPKGMHSPG